MTANPIQLYYREGVLTYDTPDGRMTTPPHVQTPADCAIYFAGRPFTFIETPGLKLSSPEQIRALERRKREAQALSRKLRKEERLRELAAAKAENKSKPACCDHRYTSGNWKGHVAQYTLEGKYVATYNSAREAARKIGISCTAVVYGCRGAGRSCHGYQWRWLEGEKPPRKIAPYIDGRKLRAKNK